ncbi:AAA family ATPase [Actinomadura viridis]|uniref:helix-turn-helix transcriptional regulator n=1 Tax=Actinomadura viridis TaxID=58110 RepID=UPI0036CD814F
MVTAPTHLPGTPPRPATRKGRPRELPVGGHAPGPAAAPGVHPAPVPAPAAHPAAHPGVHPGPASGPGVHPAAPLGRDRELETIRALLARARAGRGGALTILGGPGLGKSTLLETAAGPTGSSGSSGSGGSDSSGGSGGSGGFRVLRARGVRQECAVPYAGLHRLLRPLSDAIARLPRCHAEALAPVADGAAAPATSPLPLYAAVRALLAEAAADGPVLCRVDDAHRLDRVSLEALAFAARRAEDVPVAFLFAARSGHPGSPVGDCLGDLPYLVLDPLDEAAGLRLLEGLVTGPLDEETAAEVTALAGGNPLALVELASALTPGQLAGTAPPPRALPEGGVLRSHYRRRYLRLTDGARRLVLMAAADDRLDLAALTRAAGAARIDLRELEWARASGLIRVDGDRVDVPGPVVRSSVYAGAAPAERRAVHALLSEILDGDRETARRDWHRAALATEPDDALAARLADAARSLGNAGRHADAARFWQRAATLATAPGVRADRYLAAARSSWNAGRARRARVLLRRARPHAGDPVRSGRADLLQGEIEMGDGMPVMALWILRDAADRLAEADPPLALRALLRASAAADASGDHHCHEAIARRAIEIAGRAPAAGSPGRSGHVGEVEVIHDYFAGTRAAVLGRREEASGRLRRVLAAADAGGDTDLGADLGAAAVTAALTLGEDRRARDLAARAAARTGVRTGAAAEPHALTRLAHCEILLGLYPAAEATAREGLRLAGAAGRRDQVAENRAVLALLAAFRGDRDAALGRLDGPAGPAGRDGGRGPVGGRDPVRAGFLDTWARACLDLADDRPADAAARLRHPGGTGPGHPVLWPLAVPHLVEAAVRADGHERALRAFAAFESWAAEGRGPVRAALAARCRALLAGDDVAAGEHFEEALRLHEDGDSPFELARTALLYGSRLRRVRRPRDAREHLRNAAQIFQRAGAERWAARARAELRAAGETLDRPEREEGPDPLAGLTAQQAHIARLVAEGATNREIAARLVISPRTVDGHLRNIFTRLGLRSRIELARLLR